MFFFDFDEELVENKPNNTSIQRITIKELFGKSDVTLNFQKEVNIYIGENGLGKTTILNCIYYILCNDYERLITIPFSAIMIKFKDTDEISITKEDVLKYVKNRRVIRMRYREEDIYSHIKILLDRYNLDKTELLNDDLKEKIIVILCRSYGFSYSVANSYILSYTSHENSREGEEKNIRNLKEAISKNITERVIYLTTYRRIEKDYSDSFNLENERYNHMENERYNHTEDSLIRFGMKDVSKAINNLLENIRAKTNQEFNKMTGLLLSKYAKINLPEPTDSNYKEIDLVKIVLDRLGKQINEEDKELILQLISNSDIDKKDYKYLRDLIAELIGSYNSLAIYDEKIIKFKDTCNKYLNNKRFEYNQSDVTLKILSDTDEEIELSMLSSGEKQIVSLFSRLYLESDKKCILLIDEPELSISMRWQKMLLPDIMRSSNCKLLLTVTHSPFIFENEFDNDTRDIWNCFNWSGYTELF